jgi:aldose 1-epimerase
VIKDNDELVFRRVGCNIVQSSKDVVVLEKEGEFRVEIANYGATIMKIYALDRNGKLDDVVLGYDSAESYEKSKNPIYMGSIVGRCANRICEGKFFLEGKDVQVSVNHPPNSLHGGFLGFSKVFWKRNVQDNSVEFTYTSADGEEGYPGNLEVRVTYQIVEKVSPNKKGQYGISIQYEATTDKTTIVNLTSHPYFNLAGHGNGKNKYISYITDHFFIELGLILDHELEIAANAYTPVDYGMIPSGKIIDVKGTALDFTSAKKIQKDLELVLPETQGFDHNFVLSKPAEKLGFAAKAFCPESGRVMEVFTDQPGMQLYTGNWIEIGVGEENGEITKDKVQYQDYSGFCLEAQAFPDAINKPRFPSVILRPSEGYKQTTIYLFSAE